jgi:hypothetical protein
MADSDPDKAANQAATDVQTKADAEVQKVRSWAGMIVVAVGDVAIVVAAVLGILHVSGSDKNATSVVAILSSGFTAIGTMTTAYFGIRAASNTAQSSISNR